MTYFLGHLQEVGIFLVDGKNGIMQSCSYIDNYILWHNVGVNLANSYKKVYARII